MPLAELTDPLPYQGGMNSSESSVGQLGADPLHLRVEVPRVEEARAVRVGLRCDRPEERRGGRRADHQHVLAGLDVRADLDDQLGVAGEQRAVHGGGDYSVRRIAYAAREPSPPFNPVQ